MAKPQYGAKHRQARAIAIATLIDGTPCRYCLRPMYKWQSLDLDHMVPVMRGNGEGPTVLTHSHCNRSHGAKLGNRNRARAKNGGRGVPNTGRKATGRGVPKRLPKWL